MNDTNPADQPIAVQDDTASALNRRDPAVSGSNNLTQPEATSIEGLPSGLLEGPISPRHKSTQELNNRFNDVISGQFDADEEIEGIDSPKACIGAHGGNAQAAQGAGAGRYGFPAGNGATHHGRAASRSTTSLRTSDSVFNLVTASR
jgi:hypothetical protein